MTVGGAGMTVNMTTRPRIAEAHWLDDGQDGDAMMETVEVLIPVAAVGMVQFLRVPEPESAGP